MLFWAQTQDNLGCPESEVVFPKHTHREEIKKVSFITCFLALFWNLTVNSII